METSPSALGAGPGTELLEAPTCRHQWIIDSPNGPSSKGVCRLCDEEKEFQNYIEGSAWGYDMSVEQLGRNSGIPSISQMQRGKSVDGDE